MTDLANDVLPGSSGGVIEAVKRGVVTAFRSALTGTSLSQTKRDIHVDMEYPVEQTNYPGIWVQFSLSELQPSGIGHAMKDTETGGTVQQWSYKGRVSLTLLAMSSIERDRIADHIITTFAFSRVSGVDDTGLYSESYSDLFQAFNDNPYLSMTINADSLKPGGQSITVGTPWDESQLVYEDNYAFELQGEFQMVSVPDGGIILRRVDIYPEIALPSSEWQ